MSALARITPRVTAMGKFFATWTLGDGGEQQRCDLLEATTLAEALAFATPPIMPLALAKGGFPAFVILETDDAAREGRARHLVHFYTVKVRREWRSIGPLGSTAQAAVPYAVHGGSMAMDAFEPRRPFRAGVDDAANGRQPGEARLIEIGARK